MTQEPQQVEANAEASQDAGERLTAGTVPSGGGYRAIASIDGRVVWSCSHVHFTDHSARACAERHVKALAQSEAPEQRTPP